MKITYTLTYAETKLLKFLAETPIHIFKTEQNFMNTDEYRSLLKNNFISTNIYGIVIIVAVTELGRNHTI
jgi:DNA-binding response OmpR family regulator